MSLDTDQQLENTRKKLALIEAQISKARSRPQTPSNAESVQSLVRMANQLREEIVVYLGHQKRQAS